MAPSSQTHTDSFNTNSPALQAQRDFRVLLDAMANPGRILQLQDSTPQVPSLEPATTSICLALADLESPLWFSPEQNLNTKLRDYFAFHTGSPIILDPVQATFAVITHFESMPPLNCFSLGTAESPENSTTVILQVSELSQSQGVRLTGPGIESARFLNIPECPEMFWQQRQDLRHVFPQGVDIVFTCGDRLAALPRSTKVEFCGKIEGA
jgi:alpha-D-ribose 1-methylphosphonate 5-triphosphate synthase subunit PhnH